LNTRYLYLLLDLFTFIIPFLFSFHPKIRFDKKWRSVIPAIIGSAIIFIAWDMFFTKAGVWGFNEKYLTGFFIYNLPIEEILFFFCIPYACLFTHHALTTLMEKDHLFPHHEIISSVLIIISLVTGLYFRERMYTSVTFLLTGFFLAFHMLKMRPNYMGRFYFSYMILLVPFLLVNGALTGSFTEEPVVWYNNEENMGIRLGTIPVEDVFYGMMMLLLPIFFADKIQEYYLAQKRKTLKRQGSSVF
jgi:lycopene cyclase domain-containing protein